jgi:hypothetical protein
LPAEQRAAGLLVERHDLAPPVDVLALLREYADVEIADWPYDCDALVRGLTGIRPQVFLRGNVAPRRQRFTAAHELGHICLAWHIGAIACHATTSLPSWLAGSREAEANRFASALLVPDRFLAGVTAGPPDVARWIGQVAAADVNAVAGMIALARALPPGYLFIVEQPAGPHEIPSTGTPFRLAWPEGVPDYERLERDAHDSGRVVHQGRQVRWYRFVDGNIPGPDDDPRTTTDILRAAVGRVGGITSDGRSLLNVVNGMIGGVLPRHASANPGEMYRTLLMRARNHPDARWLADDPDFQRFLARKVRKPAGHRSGD